MKILSRDFRLAGLSDAVYIQAFNMALHDLSTAAQERDLTIRWDTLNVTIEKVVRTVEDVTLTGKVGTLETWWTNELHARVEADE